MWKLFQVQPYKCSKCRIPVVIRTICACTLPIHTIGKKKTKWGFEVPRKFPGHSSTFQPQDKSSEPSVDRSRRDCELAGTSQHLRIEAGLCHELPIPEAVEDGGVFRGAISCGNGRNGCVNHQRYSQSVSWASYGPALRCRHHVSGVHQNQELALMLRQSLVIALAWWGQCPVLIARASSSYKCAFSVAAISDRGEERHSTDFSKEIQLTSIMFSGS